MTCPLRASSLKTSGLTFVATLLSASSPHFVRLDSTEEESKNTIESIMWTVYLLLCDQKIIYTGLTNNFKRRIEEHKSKTSRFTKQFSDLKLLYSETYETKLEAAKREKEIKGWSRKKKLALII